MATWRLACLWLMLLLPLRGWAEICVQDDRGASVCLGQPAQRIVSLSPHLTEQIFWVGAGQQVIAVDDSSDFPLETNALPRLGRVQQFDLERLLALKPDLVLAWQSGISPVMVRQLESAGVPVYVSEPLALEQIADGMLDLFALSGQKQGSARVGAWMEGFEQLQLRHAASKPVRVFYQTWETPLMTLGGRHLVSRLIERCGGVNVFSDLDTLAPQVSLEEAVNRKPELILGSGPPQAVMASLAFWRDYPAVPAVRNDAIKAFAPDILVRPGPRVLEAAESLCRLIDEVRQP